MGDRDIVAAIVAGDPAGLAAAYDQYAASLHAYCRTLLGEPADAADAVQDTFVVAAAKTAGLRDPDRLRPWLYAVARNECHRRLRGRARQADLDEADEPADDYTDLSEQAERAELRGLVVAAIGGLNPGDREVIELNLRHDLDGADLAQALGVPANQGYALASRARGQFERSLGALLVAQTGRQDCAELNRLLAVWDGELTPLLRKRVSRHIENCEVCGERKRRVLSPAMLLTALPLVPLPAGLRHQVLRLVSDDSPEAVAYCVHVAARSRPFDASGFPVQLAPVAGVRGRRSGRSGRSGGPGGGASHARPAPGRSVLASVGVAAGLFLLGGGSVAWLLVTGAAHSLDLTSPQVGSVPSSAVAAAPPASSAPPAPSPQPAGLPHGPAQSGPDSSAAGSGPAAPPPGSAPASVPVSPSSPPPPSRPPSSPPPSSSPPTAPPRPGILAESPATVVLAPDNNGGDAAGAIAAPTWSGTFTLTATGGPVSFSIRAPAPFTVRPARGTVFPGQPVTVTVSVVAGDRVPFLTTLTVRPGGLFVLVEFPPSSPPPSPPASSPPPSSDPSPPSASPPPTQPE